MIEAPNPLSFRFLTHEQFAQLDVKAKALYLIRAQQEIENQQDILRCHRERLTAQIGAIVELGRDGLQLPGTETPQ